MIDVRCSKCGMNYSLDDEMAGQTAECECGAEILVRTVGAGTTPPLPPPPPSMPASRPTACPKCGAQVKPDAVICINCGNNLRLGINVKTIAKAKKAGSFGLALGVGAAAALLTGLLWAGIAIGINMEIGWVAIGVGAVTGFAAVMFTEERSVRLGMAAAALAILGLLVGKLVTANYFYNKEFKAIAEDAEALDEYVFWGLVYNGGATGELAEWLKSNNPDDVEIPEKLRNELMMEVKKKISAMSQEEKRGATDAMVESYLGSVGYASRVISFMSLWDILWFFLAVGTAWKIGNGTND